MHVPAQMGLDLDAVHRTQGSGETGAACRWLRGRGWSRLVPAGPGWSRLVPAGPGWSRRVAPAGRRRSIAPRRRSIAPRRRLHSTRRRSIAPRRRSIAPRRAPWPRPRWSAGRRRRAGPPGHVRRCSAAQLLPTAAVLRTLSDVSRPRTPKGRAARPLPDWPSSIPRAHAGVVRAGLHQTLPAVGGHGAVGPDNRRTGQHGHASRLRQVSNSWRSHGRADPDELEALSVTHSTRIFPVQGPEPHRVGAGARRTLRRRVTAARSRSSSPCRA